VRIADKADLNRQIRTVLEMDGPLFKAEAA
jgi:hypothetical protein